MSISLRCHQHPEDYQRADDFLIARCQPEAAVLEGIRHCGELDAS